MNQHPPLNKYPWRYDPRSKKFSHHIFFGTAPAVSLPATLGRVLRTVENQYTYNRCAAYASALNGGYIRGQRMSPDYQAAKITQEQGFSIDLDGSQTDATMNVQIDYGYLPYASSPLTVETNGAASADPTKYPKSLDATAQQYRDEGYVTVDGPNDTFDNIRSALSLAYDPLTGQGAVVQVFGRWFKDWTSSPGGVISTASQFLGYHSYDIVDWTIMNGIPYLIIQNSWGIGAGNGGYFFIPRTIVNLEYPKNAQLKIPKPLTPEQINLAAQETSWGAIQRAIINIWYTISKEFYSAH